MFTIIAYSESVDPGAAYNALTAVADQHVRVSGDDIQIPSLNHVVAVAGLVENAAANRARLVSPSLRVRSNFQVQPLNGGAAAAVEPASPAAVVDLRSSPLVLAAGEQLNFEVFSDPVAAQRQSGVVWLADAPIAPIAGPIFTVRATSATALAAGAWSNVAVVFEEDLPRGRYQLVGLWPVSAGMIAARAVLVGYQWRPGALGADSVNDIGHPTMDCLSVSADATQEFWLDLIQVRAGGA